MHCINCSLQQNYFSLNEPLQAKKSADSPSFAKLQNN